MGLYHFCIPISLVMLLTVVHGGAKLEIVYEWNELDYTWANPGIKEMYIKDSRFIPENNVIAGVKVYKDQVFVTVPRWLPGVPSTMNKVVMKKNKPFLQPFPSWPWQRLDRCDSFQYTQSMEIDTIQGHMWIIDAGRRNIFIQGHEINKCPPKLIIYDLENHMVLHKHVFSENVVSHHKNFLNDIVVDFDRGVAYITDTGEGPLSGKPGGIVVFDWNKDKAHRIEHASMLPDLSNSKIAMNGKEYDFPFPIDGIALSPEADYLFYTPLGGLKLYQIPTSAIRESQVLTTPLPVRNMGSKPSQTDGMVMGHERLYFGSLSLNAIHVWDYKNDMENQKKNLGDVVMETVRELVGDDDLLMWPDGFDIDDNGYLWVTSNKCPMFKDHELDIGGSSIGHFRVGKVYVGDAGYKTKLHGWAGFLWFYLFLFAVAVLLYVCLGCSEVTTNAKRTSQAKRK